MILLSLRYDPLNDFMICNTSKYSWDALDKIYHSNTMNEMRVNADLEGVDLNDVDVLMFLIDQTTYHHAFWYHTKKRFTALKTLLRNDSSIESSSRSKELYDRVMKRYNELKDDISNLAAMRTPGQKQRLKNYECVLKILETPVKHKKEL